MAELCQTCSIETYGEDSRDFVGLPASEAARTVLCEGCGLIHVDNHGARVRILLSADELQDMQKATAQLDRE